MIPKRVKEELKEPLDAEFIILSACLECKFASNNVSPDTQPSVFVQNCVEDRTRSTYYMSHIYILETLKQRVVLNPE